MTTPTCTSSPSGKPSTSTGALLCLLTVVPSVLAFAPPPGSTTTGHNFHRHIIDSSTTTSYPSRLPTSTAKTTSSTALGYASSPLPSTNDPYVLLGLSTQEGSRLSGGGGAATAYDEKEVKRAFRRMTKLYHPDAVTTKDSTEAERRQANDDFARINAAYQAIVNPAAVEAPKTVQVQKPWYESVTDFTDTVSNGGAVSDIFERNAQKRKEGRQNPYSGMGGTWVSGARSTGPPPNAAGGAKAERNGNAHNDGKARTSSSSSAKSAKGRSTNNAGTTSRPNSTSKNNNSNPFGGFTSSAANTMSDIFDRNARKRDEHRRAGTGPYDPNQSVLEEKLASLMKQAAEADERYNNLKREMMNGDSSLKEQNVALRRDAAGYKARCQSLEEELKTAQVKAAAAAKASTAAAATKKNNGSLSSKEKAVLGEKIAALRKEASDAKAKCSAMEEQVAVAQVRCESLEAALKTAKAELDEKKKGGRWGFGSGGDAKDADEENEALQAKVDELETSVRNHVDVVQKYKKECDTLKQKAEKNISGTNGNDLSADKAGPKRERSSLRQAFRMRVSQTAAKSTEFIKEPSLKILNKLNRSRKNGRKDATTPIDSTSDAPTLDSPSPRATIATHGKRIPTGARAKARMMPNHKYTTKKSSEFASAVGIASSSAKESVKGEASVASLSSERSLSSVDTLRRVSDRMHEKKALIISGSVALLVVRSLLKAWIKGGLL